MRVRWGLVFLGLIWPAVGSAQDPGPSRPIFREISVRPIGHIQLGEPFAQRDSVARHLGKGVYQLPAGFGDTKAILVKVDSLNMVEAMVFIYVENKNFDEASDAYVADLGAPIAKQDSAAIGGRIRRISWQDDVTYFELMERTWADSAEVLGFLRNR